MAIFHEILKYSLGPVILTQGIYLRKYTPDLPEPDGARQGTMGQGQPLKLLIAGDSSAAGVGAPTQDAALSGQLLKNIATEREVTWSLIAKTAWTTEDMLDHLESVDDLPYDVSVSSLGVNDALCGFPVKRHIRNQKRFVELLKKKFQVKKCYLSALPPMQKFPLLPQPLAWFLGRSARVYNRALRDWIQTEPDLEFIPIEFPLTPEMLATDMFHPGPPTYKAWGEMVGARILADQALFPSQVEA